MSPACSYTLLLYEKWGGVRGKDDSWMKKKGQLKPKLIKCSKERSETCFDPNLPELLRAIRSDFQRVMILSRQGIQII